MVAHRFGWRYSKRENIFVNGDAYAGRATDWQCRLSATRRVSLDVSMACLLIQH